MLVRFRNLVQAHRLASLQLGLLTLLSVGLRLVGLGYSDFQGDEISAFCSLTSFSSLNQLIGFLLEQRKGPLQYFVTCATSLATPGFADEFLARLPFAAASLLAVACFFVLAWQLFDFTTAVYAGGLLATSGLFVAFGRIVQYQSFVVLGTTAALMALTLALKTPRWRILGLYLGSVSAAIAILAHFDAAFLFPPLAVLLIHWWQVARRQSNFDRLRKHAVAALVLFGLLALGFYLPYFFRLKPNLLKYWGERFNGPTTDVMRLLSYYIPAPVLWPTIIAAAIGLLQIRRNLAGQVVLAWLLPPLLFMELLFNDSRTHIYTYWLAVLLLGGVGIRKVVLWAKSRADDRGSWAAHALALGFVILSGWAAYDLLVDHNPEYPWQAKRVLGAEMAGGNLTGTFGFPYSRDWREIGAWFASLGDQPVTIVTNEKPELASFYLPRRDPIKYATLDLPEEPPPEVALYVLQVRGPQSWFDRLWGWPLPAWETRLPPIKVFFDAQNQPEAWVWLLDRDTLMSQFYGSP